MANQEQLDILKQGVEVWNAWRATQAWYFSPDLGFANLRGADLRLAHLRRAKLNGANLNEADLFDASLFGAILIGTSLRLANLHDANLINTKLDRAKLDNADLTSANLSSAELQDALLDHADLTSANLSNANLWQANLTGATIGLTIFGAVDLSVVKGLDTIKYSLPSTIGIDTIYRSKGDIPEVFLKGVGVDDTFITYIRSLVGKPIEYYSCFISYASQDEAFAKRLHADLQSHNVRCWFAPEDLKIGDKIRTGIDEAIRIHDKLLLVLSENSVESTWVEKEVETAFDKETKTHKLVLFPVRLDNTVMETNQAWAADIRRMRNIGDFTHWKDHDDYQKAFSRLLRDLKSETK